MTDHSYSASTSDTWYIDSGALSQMTGAREMFSKLSQADTNVEVVLGDDSVVNAVGHGTITFQRESMSPMVLQDLLYAPGMKKTPSVSFHDRGLGSWGILSRRTCAYVSQDCRTICFSCYWS